MLTGGIVSTEMSKVLNTDSIQWGPGYTDVCINQASWALHVCIFSVHVSSSSSGRKQGEETQAFPDFAGSNILAERYPTVSTKLGL